MRTITSYKILYVGLLIFTVNTVFGQVYKPFPETTAFWTVYHRPAPGGLSGPYEFYHGYQMLGDTVIGAYSYNKIYRHDWKMYMVGGVYTPLGSTYYYGGIRQDILAKRVYAIFPSDNVDTLLYDFNLSVGDTLLQSYTLLYDNTFVPPYGVSAIGNVVFQSQNFKKFNVTGALMDAAWIEGVGNSNGLFEKTMGFFEEGFELLDFCDAATQDCSALATGMNEHSQGQTYIYPNPFHNNLNITSPGNKIDNLQVYSIYGQLVANYTEPEEHLSLSFLNDGVYFLKLTGSTGTEIHRIVKE